MRTGCFSITGVCLRFLAIMLFPLSGTAQEHLACMTVSLASVGTHSTVSFYKGDTVVVFEPGEPATSWAVWTSSGQSAFVNRTYFQLIPDKPIFKLITNKEQLKETACSRHTKENFDLIRVDYCDLIGRIIAKEPAALTSFFDLIPEVHASLAEIHANDTWQVINLFTDEELKAWLSTLSDEQLDRIMQYLKREYVAYPITRYALYLGLYYPKSWILLQKHE
jgi:hypothetical protein